MLFDPGIIWNLAGEIASHVFPVSQPSCMNEKQWNLVAGITGQK